MHFPLLSNTLMQINALQFQLPWLFTKQEFPLRKLFKRDVLLYFPDNGRPLQVQSHIQLYATEQNNRTVHEDKFCAHLIETLVKKLGESNVFQSL